MQKIRKGDEVIVIAGRDKNRRGVVLERVDADHVIVEGINVVKKHTRPNPMANNPGGIVSKNLPIHISNVKIFNAASGKADKVVFKDEDGRKVRVFRSSGEVVGVKA
ncbi:50S ribosomal protein L24 [Taylorella equigenitalis]|uniref:Large ribosomal subunit protein uL24 n=3 Tax=Taylorella equigenitalis TaxID=29575 RepID=A0A654KGB9_TAYEM|nr:50S ribosomal protein L24 [Taylorella equigenitalis]ADU91484.1 LSU ribosomal protein L24p (L26e) [Taylorella equigenitalis MCE9]AFN36568.1 50S ribosomal protein L24 [Taylorella equigenitalis ATCC 35865]ASY31135.1 50S ribosomal protein L24 [Taylorella equigenitalis]ASY38435.1 50S ribosomal protein L24 [Taylorella equigenitalis]ASY39970.1 50S ribosomal protein L24 [Taylorella equigenitalis]